MPVGGVGCSPCLPRDSPAETFPSLKIPHHFHNAPTHSVQSESQVRSRIPTGVPEIN
jgi:hypothetical protein